MLATNSLLALLIVSGFLTGSFAQSIDIKFKRLSIEHGLSQSSVRTIIQDKKGFMWFGTPVGLNKYDGYRFTVYMHDPKNNKSLSDSYIYHLHEDYSGNLWIGTRTGLNKFDPETDNFSRFITKVDAIEGSFNNQIYKIQSDAAGNLWIGTFNGLLEIKSADKSISYFIHKPVNRNDSFNYQVNTIFIDSNGMLWLGTNRGLELFDPKNQTFTSHLSGKNNTIIKITNSINTIYEDRFKNIWIGAVDGLYKYDKERQHLDFYQNDYKNIKSISHNYIRSVFSDHLGRLWIGTDGGGLNNYDYSKKHFYSYQYDPLELSSIINNSVYDIYEDRSGVIWVGTWNGGLIYFESIKKQFDTYTNEPKNINSLSNRSVNSIHEDRLGNLWIGTMNGLNRFNIEKNNFKHYKNIPDNSNSLSNNTIWRTYVDHLDNIWLGTLNGCNRLNPRTGRFTRFIYDADNPQSISNNNIHCFFEDRLNNLWIGTENGGLNKLVLSDNPPRFERFQHNPDDPHSISHNMILSIHEDYLNYLWVGTWSGGLNRMDRKTKRFKRYLADPNNPKSISDNNILSIFSDSFNRLWLGSEKGLILFNYEDESFTNYTIEDGLPDNVISGILEDNRKNLWLSTNKGLSKFNPFTKIFKNYDVSDGLLDNEYNHLACYFAHNGKMYFGGINGISAFYPDSIDINLFKPPIVITDFKISNKEVPIGKGPDGRSILQKSITETDQIELSYEDYIFSLEFAALHYSSPEQNQYAYRMEGLENDWNEVGRRRYVTYSNIPPGNYVFRVKGSNSDGIWNETGASLKITVTPPYWKTWWFGTASILFLVMLIVFAYQYRTRSIRQRSKELEKRVNERTIELQNEINERKKAEEEIERRQNYLESFLYNTPNAIITLDINNFITEWNPGAEQIFKYKRDEALGKNIDSLINRNKITKEVRDITTQVLSGKKVIPRETVRYRKDGTGIHVILAASPIKIANTLQGVVVVYTDISRQKDTEQALREAKEAAEAATKAKSEFLANMSHEIRTPMNGVIGMTRLLLDTNLSSEQHDFAETINNSADKLMTIINDILDFSKIEAGRLYLEKLDFNLRQVVEEVGDFLILEAERKGIQLHCIVNHDVPSYLQGDPGRLRQVLINLTGNAIKFTHEGEVVIQSTLEKESDEFTKLRFEVSDTGIGIPKNRRDKLFNSFSQVDSSMTRKYGGTGLGLAISKRLVGMMDGLIGVESSEGKGSSFWFTAIFQKQSRKHEISEISMDIIKRQRILIFDEKEITRKTVREQLKYLGFQFDEATSSKSALKKLIKASQQEKPFNLVVMDYDLLNTNPENFFNDIKDNPDINNIKIIILILPTKRNDLAQIQNIFPATYLTKPVKQSQLLESICKMAQKIKYIRDTQPDDSFEKNYFSVDKKHKGRILLIENNITNQKIALRVFEKMGYQADAAFNGREAIISLGSLSYDIIFMDVQMPEMDGFETTKIIRNSKSKVKNHNIPIIAMTAHTEQKEKDRCIGAGMDDFISKPFKIKEINEVINKHLSNNPIRAST